MMRIAIGYPDHDAEVEVVTNGARGPHARRSSSR